MSWVAHDRARACTGPAPSTDAIAFHRRLEGYSPTPLVDLPDLATELGVGRLLAKDESARLGLPAFKALGASWAVERVGAANPGRTLTLVTATDGNHGRAVARFARQRGHRAGIYIPRGVHQYAIDAIASEGAEVIAVDGAYEDAVAAATRAAEAPDTILVQDMAWEGYDEIPGWIIEGYETLFLEIDEQLRAANLGGPDLLVVPVGVGSLLQSALAHYRSATAAPTTAIVSVEPDVAACVPPSLSAGRPVAVRTELTIMAGLNCGTLSTQAWPLIRDGLDGATTVSDAAATEAAHALARCGVAAGPCGAAALAAAREITTGPGARDRRTHLRLEPDCTVVLLVTEGSSTNPVPPNAAQ